jgi:alanyl-tRNA synthetase
MAGETKVVVQDYAEADAAALRGWVDDIRSRTGRFVAVAAGRGNGPALVVAASRDLASEGFDAAAIIRAVGPMIGGGGGGRAELAQAGGKDPSRLDEALAEATRLALEALQPIENA